MVTDFHSSADASDSSPDISDSTPDASGLSSTSPIPLDMLMTRKEVAQTLRITTHCLNTHKEKWKEAVKEQHEKKRKYQVWTPVKLSSIPRRAKILTSTWAMKKKTNRILRVLLHMRGYE